MDNIFTSLANGVIAIDSTGIITTFNNAAGIILNLNPEAVIGKHYREVFSARPQIDFIRLLENVQMQQKYGTVVTHSVDCEIPGRHDRAYLNISISSLCNERGVPIGTALILDDRTEQKRREAEVEAIRKIFKHYVHPHVVEQLIKNPKALRLGGETREITIIFADIRGYTRLSENLEPEEVMSILNSYLKIMVERIWEQEGTVTAFMGDALMAIFNAPLRQKDHPLRAVRATWNMRQAVLDYQRSHPQQTPISFGFGINTGLATVGNVGSAKHIQNYTAIGDAVNVASRLQAKATDNEILLNDSTYLEVHRHVHVEPPFPLDLKNRAMQAKVRRLKGLV
jgi:PAS domain S-box-containing protein